MLLRLINLLYIIIISKQLVYIECLSSIPNKAGIASLQPQQQQQSLVIDSNLLRAVSTIPNNDRFNDLENMIYSNLKHHNAEEEEARSAAMSVKRYALQRFRRRRLRWLMKERDSLQINACTSDENMDILQTIVDGHPGTKFKLDLTRIENILKHLMEFDGLTGKDCAAVFLHTPSLALSKNGLVQVDSTMELLCKRLKLRRYDARKMIRQCPGLLTESGANTASQIVDMFVSMGVSVTALARDKVGLPLLLTRQPGALFRLAAFLASDSIRLPVDRVGAFLTKPSSVELVNQVVPLEYQLYKVDTSAGSNQFKPTSTEYLSGTTSKLREKINLTYKRMKQNAEILRNEMDFSDMANIVSSYPDILLFNTTAHVKPAINFLIDEIGIDQDNGDVIKILQAFPTLLGIETQSLRNSLIFLKSLGIKQGDLKKMVRAFPSLLVMDVEEQMMPVVSFLREIGVINVGRFISRLPPILGYSVENELRPKWNYISTNFERDYFFEVLRFPAYFSYPLERVIKPRFEYLRKRRIPPRAVSLDSVLRFGDADFAKEVIGDNDVSQFEAFCTQCLIGNNKPLQNKNGYKKRRPKFRSKRRRISQL